MDEFNMLLNLIRTDFKDAGRDFAEAEDTDALLRLIRKHKLGTQVFFFGKNGLPPALRERLETEYTVSSAQFEKSIVWFRDRSFCPRKRVYRSLDLLF
jgi:hypothetical protein